MNAVRKVTGPSLLAMMIMMFAAGCAQEVGDIDRTQPNAIEKSDLNPDEEWYYQRTVVDVPAADGFTFVGGTDYSGMKRIKWDIQENFLYARRQTELIDGADNKEEMGDDYEGEVVAAYRIQSHFDIQRQYSTSTGETTNVIVEDRSDRPWHEREYMRVDWSTNLVTNYDLDFERASIEPVPYYIQDLGDDDPHAPLFDYSDHEVEGDPQLDYFDITNKIHARAGTIFLAGFGEIPLCWLRGFEFTECGAGEYTIRNSFKRIDPDREYVPMPYKGKATDVFGFFTTDRMEYSGQEGIREQNKKRYLNRYNLWKQWHDEEGELLPHEERELRPIVYHVNRDFPDDLKDVAATVANQWNRVFVDVVEATGYELDDGEQPFILCPHNPVESGDPEACGEPGTSPRLGDIRYSFMAYIPEFMDYGLLGLGPSNNDPETGEIISGMGYVYHWNDISAYRTTEMVELLNGTLDPDEFIDGVDLSEWANQVNDGDRAAPRTFDVDREGEHFVERIANRFDGERIPITEADVEKQRKEGFDAFIDEHLERLHRHSRISGERSSPDGRLRELEDTYIEDLLITDEVLMGTGHQPGTSVHEDNIEAASVIRGGLGQHAMELAEVREEFAEQRNMYLPEMADDALLGLARELAGEDRDDIYETVREAIYTAVLAHEVGHALGLMHNFSGTEDAVNYFDEYWEIRDRGEGEVQPRIEQPITDEEIDEKIYHHAYSSVMDYTGRMTLDGLGIGKYDRAAILYAYAGKVEVFEDRGNVSHSTLRDWFEQRGDVLSFETTGPQAVHYTSLYNDMGELLYSDDNRKLVDLDDLVVEDGSRDWSLAEVDGQQYSRVPYVYCSHANYNLGDSCLTRTYGADSYERLKHILDDLNTWYITRSFPRGRIGVNSWGYISSYYPRIYNRLKRWHDLYGLYAELLPQFFAPSTVENFFTDPVDGWGGKTWAVKNAFNYLIQTLLMPDVGPYEQRTLVDGTEMYTDPMRFINAELDVTQGRYYSTSWHDGDRECGYMWWECLHHIGFYLDKIMAIEALSDTQTNFVARSTPEDIREWEVGYFNTFGEQILEINEALMGQDYSTVGPYLDGQQQVQFPDYTGELNEVHDGIIDPYATFTIQLYWQVLGQARFPRGYDQSFMENSRIWIRGLGNAPEIDEDYIVSFRDPWTGYVYQTTDRGGLSSAGQAMLERANYLLAMTDMCDDEELPDSANIECFEDVSSTDSAEATDELRSYMELIQAIAYITPKLSHGNPYAP